MDETQWRELVAQTRQGNKEAFVKLYNETQRSVYFTALKLTANEDNAKDVMQDTFMTALEKLDTLEDGAKFPQWVNGIAINKCRQYFRKPTAESLDEQTELGLELKDDESFIPEEYVTDSAKRKIIMDIINKQLSDVQRQTIILYYYDEQSLEQISQVMDCPVKTVSSRLVSAREKIKAGVLSYEKKHNDKLYSVAAVPVLAVILRLEAEQTVVPQAIAQAVLSAISSASASTAVGAGAGVGTATAATATAGFVGAAAVGGAAGAAVSGGAVGVAAAGGAITAKVVAAITAGVLAAGGIATAGFLSGDGSGRTVGDPAHDPFASSNVYMMPGDDSGTSSPTVKTGAWDIQQLSAVMESIKNKPTAEAKQILSDNFGVAADSWQTEADGGDIYHTAKLSKAIKVYENEFDTIEIIENSAGVIDPEGESVSIYKAYDSYQAAVVPMSWLTGYLTNELGAGQMSMTSQWKTNSGKVTVSLNFATDGVSGILNLGFRAK